MILLFAKNRNNVWCATSYHYSEQKKAREHIEHLNNMLLLLNAHTSCTSISDDIDNIENVIHNMDYGDKKFQHDPVNGTQYIFIDLGED
jgi:predicted secreted Zn-dependent protease